MDGQNEVDSETIATQPNMLLKGKLETRQPSIEERIANLERANIDLSQYVRQLEEKLFSHQHVDGKLVAPLKRW